MQRTAPTWTLPIAITAAIATLTMAAEPETPADDETHAPAAQFRATAEVVASRITDDPAATGRREVLLTRAEINTLPVQTLQDVLALIPGVGLTRRGARGVQGDLNLRGATFEQSVILVNGIRVNNPQTGHHNLDLFIPAAAIDRIEVLYGPGSAVHGPDAFGGAINIVTGASTLSAHLRVGENNLSGAGLAAPLGNGLWAALEREVHTGFRDNTEADVNQAAGGWSWRDADTSVDLLIAAGTRDFGAHAFYSTRFPDERETTAGELLTVRATAPLGRHRLHLAARTDSHRDTFILDRTRPDWYRNSHRTRGALLNLSVTGAAAGWSWAAGIEAARDDIRSSNLGRRHRTRSAGYFEVGGQGDRGSFGVQLRLDHQEPWGDEGTAAAGGSLRLGTRWHLRGHVGRSFRAPSFTDLYYTSPSTVGTPDLRPERGRAVEVGLDHGPWSVAAFERRADPIIDYVLAEDGVWRAGNIGRVTTRGVECAMLVPEKGRLRFQRLGFVYLDSEIDVDPARSAYALAHPKLEASWSGAVDAGHGWLAAWTVRYRDPGDRGSWSTLDLRLGRRILDNVTLTIEASNVLDRDVTELHGIPLPGRWLSVTAGYRRGQP